MFTESGICPECNSTDIEFGDINWNTDWIDPRIEQDCRCLKCDCEFKEYHDVKYSNTDVIWHGKTFKPNTQNQQE